MIRQFFSSLSYLFHPFFMPLLGLFILFETPTKPVGSLLKLDTLYYFPDNAKNVLYIVLGILTLFAPLLSLLILYKSNMISGFKLEKREERFYPYIIVTFYYVLAYVYVKYQLPDFLRHPALLGFLFGTNVIFVTSFIVNFFMKVSLHTVGIFGLSGGLLGYFQTQLLLENHDRLIFFIIFLIIIGGLIGAARIYLKAHTIGETILGMIIGFIVMYTCVRFGIFL